MQEEFEQEVVGDVSLQVDAGVNRLRLIGWWDPTSANGKAVLPILRTGSGSIGDH